jgi:serine/threonine protein kinase
MESCPETKTLIQWLHRQLNQGECNFLETHISRCQPCQNRMLELTDDQSLRLSDDPQEILGKHTFTDEPHFQSMREKLSARVAEINPQTIPPPRVPKTHTENSNSESTGQLGTFNAKIDSTLGDDRDDLDERYNLATESFSVEAIQIDGFHLESHIGSGGFARVYKAWDKTLARPVAIKLLDPARINARNRHRFLREARSASAIQSPHVVQVFTSGETKTGSPFIAMELVEGETLAAWISQAGQQLGKDDIEAGVRKLIQVCRGAEAVHEAGLVHRDIKPGNVFVDTKTGDAKLGDFGLVRILDDDSLTLTRAADLAGTPAYMSPEQTDSEYKVDAASDVYSLGATLYQVLTGQPPFRGSSLAILRQIATVNPSPPKQLNEVVSADLETICLKAMEKDPRQRYPDAASLADDLQASIDGLPIVARPISPIGQLFRWAKRNRALAATISLLFLSLLLGAIVSTSLWIRSEFYAQRSNDNAKQALENADRAEANLIKANQTQLQLIQSVKKLVATNFTRKSTYLSLSGQDREKAVAQITAVYQAVFDGQTETQTKQDPELVREIVADIAAATEINLELTNYYRAADLLNVSLGPAEQLVVTQGGLIQDRTLAAKVFNQLGDFLTHHQTQRIANRSGDALWAAESFPDMDAVEAFRKVLEFCDFDAPADSDLALERIIAHWNLSRLSKPEEGVDAEAHRDSMTQQLKDQLEFVRMMRSENPDLSASWMGIHQRMLLELSKRHSGQQSIDLRMQRAKVFKEYVETIESLGEETYWYDRNIAVNDFFIGINFLRLGKPAAAMPIMLEAKNRMSRLSAAYPRVVQFRADLAEALIVIADIDLNEQNHDRAMERFDEALAAFELCLKTDSGEVGLRRRVARVYAIVASKHIALENRKAAVACYQKALHHAEVVLKAPYDSDLKPSDAKTFEEFKAKLNKLNKLKIDSDSSAN